MIGNAVKVMRIATRKEQEDFPPDDGKDKAAQSLGQRGEERRQPCSALSEKKEIARKAAQKRWAK